SYPLPTTDGVKKRPTTRGFRTALDRAPVFTAAAVAEAPDFGVGVRDVVDRAAREESALAAVELVGPIARELKRRLIFQQPHLVAISLAPELAERVDDARLEHRYVPRRIALVAE